MTRCVVLHRRPARLLTASVALLVLAGCHARWGVVDPEVALAARRALRQEDFPPLEGFQEEPREEEPGGTIGEAILGELLAIFPGFLIHGIGHYYAGDRKTAAQLSRIGQFGYLLTGIGGGMVVGGVFAQEEDLNGLAISLYSTGGFIGGAGVAYFFTAWIYDMVDTPRAVLSGGKPPPRSKFVEAMDVFGD